MNKYRHLKTLDSFPIDDSATPLITLPNPDSHATSIRATALIFSDPASARLLKYIERIAPSDATVMIIGETGTGKELVARQVHKLSDRQAGPFVAVNCGAFSESLIESELFGHEKGAFTGAVNARSGWFEAANGGTLFLDEIGDLPLSAQVKILRVLQEREVVRVGSRTAMPIDVRLVTATNIDLAAAVQAGHFREDLFYRLNIAALNLLPLRDRPGDILPLARHFLTRYSSRLKIHHAELDKSSERALLNYMWPGNIRELENVIHHALLICKNGKVTANDLELKFNLSLSLDTQKNVKDRSTPLKSLEKALADLYEEPVDDLFNTLEETIIRTAYEYCENNQVQTGRLLNISRNILRHRLKRYGFLA